MIGAIVSLFNGGLATYRQYNRNKAEALKRKDELDQEKHQARVRRLKKRRAGQQSG